MEPEKRAAKKILAWLMVAERPLKVREIDSLFCINIERGEADFDRKPLVTCKAICGSLVDVEPINTSSDPEGTVTLVHGTAKESVLFFSFHGVRRRPKHHANVWRLADSIHGDVDQNKTLSLTRAQAS